MERWEEGEGEGEGRSEREGEGRGRERVREKRRVLGDVSYYLLFRWNRWSGVGHLPQV